MALMTDGKPASRYSLRGVLFARDAAFVVLVLVVIGAVAWSWFHQTDAQRALADRQAFHSVLQQARGDLYRIVREAFDHNLAGDAQARAHRNYYARRLDEGIQRLIALAPPERRQAVEELGSFAASIEQRSAMLVGGAAATFADVTPIYRALPLGLFETYEALFNVIESATLEEIAAAERQRRTAIWVEAAVLVAAAVLALLLFVVSRRLVTRALVRPVARIVEGAERFGKGDLDHALPETGVSEIVGIERALNAMAANLRDNRAALARSEKDAALGQLVPVVAHNIRNPLASIRAAAQVIDEPGLSSDIRDGLRDVRTTVDRLEAWLDSLLSYLNPMRLKRRTQLLDSIVNGAIDLLAARIAGRGILVTRPAAPDVWVTADAILIEQALHGLLTNAAEASADGDRIDVRIERDDAVARIVIEDRGAGFSFDPAPGSLRPGPTTKVRGSGLGLPFAYKVCEMHGGSLRFEKRDPGTRVVVTLPMAAALREAG